MLLIFFLQTTGLISTELNAIHLGLKGSNEETIHAFFKGEVIMRRQQ
jgi:hypothetical protein